MLAGQCSFSPEGCQKCRKLGVACVWPSEDNRKQSGSPFTRSLFLPDAHTDPQIARPSSKSLIKDLYQRINELESALEASRAVVGQDLQVHGIENDSSSVEWQNNRPEPAHASPVTNESPTNVIARLCSRRWQLNSDSEGQLKFFGPTSSLHLTESVSSSIFGSWGDISVHEAAWVVEDIDPETQDHLLDLYWTFQHTVLQVFHKETFLHSREMKQANYFSKALLYCIFACAARISPRPDVRSLALPTDGDLDDEQPYLISTATKYLEEELKRPGITTIQSLLLLSVVYCGLGRDTKGWLLTGDACRLAIDLGIHKTPPQLTPGTLSPADIHARQITFWGCVTFDRLWALYLGRPSCLKADDLFDQPMKMPENGTAWDAQMAFAWVTLLEIVGNICDALNSDRGNLDRLGEMDNQLQSWYSRLDMTIQQYHKDCPASVAVLHMQYCSAMILLHRSTANFGAGSSETDDQPGTSRRKCVQHAMDIAGFLRDYRQRYGDATTLSGVALHTIATAATTLVADLAERRSADVSFKMQCLKDCVRTLAEQERTYLVSRRVRKIIQLVIRLCHLESDFLSTKTQTPPSPISQSGSISADYQSGDCSATFSAEGDPFPDLDLSSYSPFGFDEFLPISSQFDIFHTFDS